MGQRANLVIIENGNYELYYDHWSATTLDADLFWGEEHALAFIRSNEQIDKSYWLNTTWCEGGLLIDLDQQQLLFFGGEEIVYDVQQRKVYLRLLEYTWPSYSIKWAQQGVLELAAYVNFTPQQPIDIEIPTLEEIETSYIMPAESDLRYLTAVYSIKQHDNIQLIPMYSHEYEVFNYGQELIDTLLSDSSFSRETLDLTTYDTPSAGVHFDLDEKSLFAWSADPVYIDQTHYQQIWNDWQLELGADNYTKQLHYCQGLLVFPEPSLETLISKIKHHLLSYNKSQPEEGYEDCENIFDQVAARFLDDYQTINQLFSSQYSKNT